MRTPPVRPRLIYRMGRKLKKGLMIGAFALTALSSSGCPRPQPFINRGAKIYKRPPIKIQQNGKIVAIGNGKNKITFTAVKGLARIDQHIHDLLKIYNLVSEINSLIPEKPLRKVIISNQQMVKKWRAEGKDALKDGGAYYSSTHELLITLCPTYLEVATHEMGHAVFEVFFAGKTDSSHTGNIAMRSNYWQKLYFLSLAHKNYKMTTDSYYINKRKGKTINWQGHPNSNAGEFFASFFMVYRLFPNEFLEEIQKPSLNPKTKEFGKLIYIFMRDRVFKGKYFSKSDPFAGSILGKIENSEVLSAICSAAKAQDAYASQTAADLLNPKTDPFSEKIAPDQVAYERRLRRHLMDEILKTPKLDSKSCP